MTFPAFIFMFLVGAFYGCLCHFFVGGNVFSVIVYLLFGVAGFVGGHYFSELLGMELLPLGIINFGWGTISCFFVLLVITLLSKPLR